MKRIRSKEKTKKIVSQKRISSRISNNIQREEDLQTFNLQNITNPFSLYDKDNSNNEKSLSNENQEEIIYDPVEFHIIESDFLSSSDSSDAESSDLEETEQTRIGPDQIIIESKTNFQPHSEEYGPYFQNFTEMIFFTWINKHMICKLNLFYFNKIQINNLNWLFSDKSI